VPPATRAVGADAVEEYCAEANGTTANNADATKMEEMLDRMVRKGCPR
jgi:hypothetical protein